MDTKQKEKIRDRIEQLKYLQKPHNQAMGYSIPILICLVTIFFTVFLFYLSKIDSNNTKSMIINFNNIIEILTLFAMVLIIFLIGTFVIILKSKSYDKLIKKNYKLLLKHK